MAISTFKSLPDVGQLVMMTRPGLTVMVSFSALVSYLVAVGVREWSVALVLWSGIFMLSAAASMLNQVQEREIDTRMARTRLRPLASGALAISEALLLVAVCLVLGLILLFSINAPTALASLLALLIYNGLYTPLKRHTSLSLFPGAISGALPIASGWLAGAGSLQDPRLCLLFIFMILWQMPHFICMAIRERDDYKRAGLSLIPDSVSSTQLVYLTRLWIAALSVAGLQLAVVGLVQNRGVAFAVAGVVLWLTFRSILPFTVASPDAFAKIQGGRLKLFLTLFLLLVLIDSVLV